MPVTTLSVRGHAEVAGNVSVENGSVAFAGTPDFIAGQRAGQLYRCTGRTGAKDPVPGLETDELRIEMDRPSRPAGIGSRSASGTRRTNGSNRASR